ncbi:TetR/AcrR family transcriptional regulator [Streptomyces sp. NA04227]|uniref:TetR/AcrR family transcriptional regulator n=1 Tax=Streptomyces sp. NA04227 TaxID=2742136 RepID=UPI0015926850|nr:TetR/AcrR family transcriptional regulator [Streptomyces sp. NA04227]QKW07980.1 TetR/AcrR family transcriptional regulator [Streptomyces sp. NA04227]
MPDIKHFDPEQALERVEELFWQQGGPATSIQAVTAATGLNRSSLYGTFGGKDALYAAALRRYLHHRSLPAFEQLSRDERGLPAIREFFAGLVAVRCTGERAGWGCMIVNAQTGAATGPDPEVHKLLDAHHRALRNAMRAALTRAAALGQLTEGTDPAAYAEVLALLAYGVNVRSRAGASARSLRKTVDAALAPLTRGSGAG